MNIFPNGLITHEKDCIHILESDKAGHSNKEELVSIICLASVANTYDILPL